MQNIYLFDKNLTDLKLPNGKNIITNPKLFEIENLNEGDIFVSYDHPSPLNLRLEYYNIPANSLVITTDKKDLSHVIKNYELYYPEDYALFSGKKLDVEKRETKVDVLRSLKLLVDVMYQMMGAGYLEMKNYKKIDDWIISFEHPVLKLFKIYHQIETSNESIDFEEEFLINPQFRQMILIMIMKIIANFVINNNMITLEKVSQLGDWENVEVWKKLRKKIKLLEEKEKEIDN